MLSTATTTAEPARPANKAKGAPSQVLQQELFQDDADDLELPLDEDFTGDIRLATDALEFNSLSEERTNGGLAPELDGEAALSLASDDALLEPSPVWALLRKVKPLPTADGNALIEIDPSPEERQSIEALWRSLPDGFKQESKELILRAYLLASYAHRAIRRESGEPYITHPIAVAQILTELRMDPEALAAGLLHDVAEDTEFGIDYLRVHYGATIAKLVDGVTKLKKIQETRSKSDAPVSNQKAESLRKMMLASIEDLPRADHQAGGPAAQYAHAGRPKRT